MTNEPVLARRTYLTLRLMANGVNMFAAAEAVASTALAHPEWDMDEVRTWVEWDDRS